MNDPESINDLSSAEIVERAKAEQNEELWWKYVSTLHRRGDREAMDRAAELLDSERAPDRSLAADILGQLGTSAKPFLEERLSKLIQLAKTDEEADVLTAVATALGHLGDHRGIEALLRLTRHSSAEVRGSVAWALPSCLGVPEDERGIQALIELSNDEDKDVRDWAVFGLATQIDSDSLAVHKALYARINDPHENTRDEALVGLARRNDMRVIEPLLAKLRSGIVSKLTVETAKDIAAESLYGALLDLQEWWDVDDSLLAEAIERCRPRA